MADIVDDSPNCLTQRHVQDYLIFALLGFLMVIFVGIAVTYVNMVDF